MLPLSESETLEFKTSLAELSESKLRRIGPTKGGRWEVIDNP